MVQQWNIEVLLLSWNEKLTFDSKYNFIEVFSGKGEVSKKMFASQLLSLLYDNFQVHDNI